MAKRKPTSARTYLAAILLMGFSLYAARFDFPTEINAEEAVVRATAEIAVGEPVFRTARLDKLTPAPPLPEHALEPVLRLAQSQYTQMASEIRDYTCRLLKRERVDGKLRPRELMDVKVRHRRSGEDGDEVPFSVYVHYLAPKSLKGREVLYVEGENDGRLLATKGGGGLLSGITINLDPTSDRAMEGNRYPLTDIGIMNIAARVQRDAEAGILRDQLHDVWMVEQTRDAKINGRIANCVQLQRTKRCAACPLHTVQMFVDEEHQVPIRFAAYHWPAEPEVAPQLVEEYTYLDVQLNVGLNSDDFSRTNPGYRFAQFDVPLSK